MLNRNSEFARLWPDLEDRINSLEKLAGPVSPTFSHNDLLAANFIDDGDRLWLIDWEYAGLNCAMFDLAGLAANNDLGDEVEDYLMEFYFGEPATSEMKQQYLALYTMCSLCEVTWALVQKEISKLNSDYDGYMRVNRQRLDSSLVRCGLAPLGEL